MGTIFQSWFSGPLGAALARLLNMSAAAGVLICAVVQLRFCLRGAPKWVRGILWALVAVQLVCPVTPASPLSVYGLLRQDHAATEQAVEVFRTYGDGIKPLLTFDARRIAAPAAAAQSQAHSVYLPAAGAVWLAGVAAMLLYALVSWLRLRRRVRASVPLEGRVMLCDAIETPFILGVFRPRIYLPSGLGEAQRAAVIAHERAHLQRRDHWWKPLGFLLLAVHWFNPLVWLAYVLLCRDIELACDEKVVRDLDAAARAAYSQTLLDCSVRRPAVRACPLAFGEVGVKERIKRILNYKKPAFWIVAVAVVVCVVVAVCFLTRPASLGSAPADPDATPYPTPEPTVTPAPLPTGTPLEDVMAMIDMATANTYILGDEYYSSPVNPIMRFYIILDMENEMFQYYETPISSYIGFGRFRLEGDILTIEDNRVNRFRLEDDKLVWLAEGSDNFTFVKLTDGAAFYLDTTPAAKPQLALEVVRALAEKGEALTWADFEPFAYEEVGSGLYIRRYPIDETFDFLIGSAAPYAEPMYFYLRNRDVNAWVDIRSRDVEDFIAAYAGADMLTEPPTLAVNAYRAGIQALRGTYSWHYAQGDGTDIEIEADSAHPLSLKGQLPRLTLGPSALSHVAPNVVTLLFDVAPDAVSVRCWSDEYWGETDAPAEAVPETWAEYRSLELREGGYIYEITAVWNSSDRWGGTATYSFYGYYSEKD